MEKQKCKRCQKTKPVQVFVEQSANHKGQKIEYEICKECRDNEARFRKQQVFKIVLEKAKQLGLAGDEEHRKIV